MTYWEKRGAQLEQLTDRRTRATAQKVAHLYDEALERIEAKIQKIYTTFAGNSHISEAEATRLMSVQQTKEARRELEALLERTADQTLRQEIITQLNAPAYGYRIAALEALRDQVYFEAKAIGDDSVAYTESRLKDLYDLGYYRTAFDLSQYEGANVPFSQLSGGRVEAAINAFWTPDVDTLAGNYSTRIWADTTQLAENVRDIVTRGLMTGGNYADMATELAAQMGDVQFTKKVEADGSTRTAATGSGAKYRATRLIRTEGNYITGQAKLQSMKDAGYEKYEFICLLETRTCSVCGGLDGKQFPVEEAQPGVNMNPMHPNCRCFVSPVVSKRLMEAGTRGAQVDASGRKETVPASMTYQEWYEKYVKGTELEKEVAKRSGAGIIKSGAVSGALDRFSNAANEHATRYYESVRHMTTDCKRIAENTGYTESEIQAIKNYIFVDKHDLGRGEPARFDVSYDMAQSWQRLIDGKNIQAHDLTMLKHETMERSLVEQGVAQDEAHIITSRIYNYEKEAAEYNDKTKKDNKGK